MDSELESEIEIIDFQIELVRSRIDWLSTGSFVAKAERRKARARLKELQTLRKKILEIS